MANERIGGERQMSFLDQHVIVGRRNVHALRLEWLLVLDVDDAECGAILEQWREKILYVPRSVLDENDWGWKIPGQTGKYLSYCRESAPRRSHRNDRRSFHRTFL